MTIDSTGLINTTYSTKHGATETTQKPLVYSGAPEGYALLRNVNDTVSFILCQDADFPMKLIASMV